MRSTHILLAILIALLLAGIACGESTSAENSTPPCEDIEIDDASAGQPDLSSEITPFDEAKCLASAKKWVKKAEKVLESVLQGENSDSVKIAYMRYMAEICARTGDEVKAISSFEAIAKLIPDDLTIREKRQQLAWLARSEANAGLFANARQTAAKLGEKGYDFGAYSSIVQAAIDKKNFVEAKRTASEPGRNDFYFRIAQAEANLGFYEEAKKTLSLWNDSEKTVAGLLLKAKCEIKIGKREAGKQTYERVKAILHKTVQSERHRSYYLKIVKVEVEAGMIKEALETLNEIGDDFSVCAIFVRMAELSYEDGNRKQAVELLKRAKEDALKNKSAYGKINGLYLVAAAESKIIGAEVAEATRQEAHRIYKDKDANKTAPPRVGERHPRKCLGVFQAKVYVLGEEAAIAEIGDNYFYRAYVAENFYAAKGDFEKAHMILRGIRKTKTMMHCAPYKYFLQGIAVKELEAGIVKYIPEIVDGLESISRAESKTFPIIAKYLARAGYEKELDDKYKSLKKESSTERFCFCTYAVHGLLKRIEDRKSAK